MIGGSEMMYRAKKDIPKSVKGYEDFGEIKKGNICNVGIFEGVRTLNFNGKWVCDFDSQMAKDYFEEVAV